MAPVLTLEGEAKKEEKTLAKWERRGMALAPQPGLGGESKHGEGHSVIQEKWSGGCIKE